MITHLQIRAARALLDWDQSDLKDATGLSMGTIQRLEQADGLAAAKLGTVRKVRDALVEAGVEFMEGDGKGVGVRLSQEG